MASTINAKTTGVGGIDASGDASGVLALQTGGTTAVTIDASQNTGMGAVSLGARLQTNCVQSSTISSPFTTQPISLQNTDTTLNNYTSICNINSAGAANAAINFVNIGQSAYPNNAGAIAFSTYAGSGAGGTEKMRIDSSGNVLVGTTGVLGKFTLSNPSNSTVGMFIQSTATGDVSNDELRIGKFDNNSTTSQIFARFTINNAALGSGSITANGANACAFGSFSDERLKENIISLPSQLNNILALRPVEFDYKTGGHQIGFIAQEMQEIYPDAIGDDGTEEKLLSITGWDKTSARLVKAIQELKAIIDTQQTRITALEAK